MDTKLKTETAFTEKFVLQVTYYNETDEAEGSMLVPFKNGDDGIVADFPMAEELSNQVNKRVYPSEGRIPAKAPH